jgi:hypothetical protein
VARRQGGQDPMEDGPSLPLLPSPGHAAAEPGARLGCRPGQCPRRRAGRPLRAAAHAALAVLQAEMGGQVRHAHYVGGLSGFLKAVRRHGWDDTLPAAAAIYRCPTLKITILAAFARSVRSARSSCAAAGSRAWTSGPDTGRGPDVRPRSRRWSRIAVYAATVASASTHGFVREADRHREASAISSSRASRASSQAFATSAVGERRAFSRLLICPVDTCDRRASSLTVHPFPRRSSPRRTPKSAAGYRSPGMS